MDGIEIDARPRLVIGALLTEAWTLFARRWRAIVPIALAAAAVLVAFHALLWSGADVAAAGGWRDLVDIVVYEAVLAVVAVAAIRLALDACAGRATDPRACAVEAFAKAPRYFLCVSLALALLIGLGLVLLIVPGLWFLGRYAVVDVAVVAGHPGDAVFRRSETLTEERIWPVAGFQIVLAVLFVAATVVSFFGSEMLADPNGHVAVSLLMTTDALATAFWSVANVALYARLRELREGFVEEGVARVFD